MEFEQPSIFPAEESPFQSFWSAGFECADHVNAHGERVDLLQLSGHDRLALEDFLAMQSFGIRTAREGIRWSLVEKRARQYDWSSAEQILDAALRTGTQVVWDICHFGFPDDCSPLHPQFSRRFASLCRAFVRWYRGRVPDGPLIVTPINEVSFISWLCGEVGGAAPFAVRMGWDVKYHLMRAYIEGIAAAREEDPGVRILTTEPLISVVPPLNPTVEEIAAAALEHENQWQSLDMLCGRMCPELGGTPDNLDILGFNYYFNNQNDITYCGCLPWANECGDPRWRPLRDLLGEASARYGRPLMLSETSHSGIDRPHWIRFVAEECAAAIQNNIPLWGICLYPIIDRPDWDHLHHWHHSGLWDRGEDGAERVLCEPYAAGLRDAQRCIAQALQGAAVLSDAV